MTAEHPSLWDPPTLPARRRRHRSASTSADGFHDAEVAGRVTKTRQAVLEALRRRGPMTRHDLAAAAGLPLSSVCGRVNELMKAGHVRELVVNGKRVVRNGRHVVTAVIHTTCAA